MLLHRVSVENFKLLENVTINFSTDSHKPLTVIRGENASGKTSLLKAMLWGFYGEEGLDKVDQDARYTSTETPAGETVTVRVTLEFEHAHNLYRVIRTCEETSRGDDKKPKRRPERVAVYRLTDAGAEKDDDLEGFIGKVIPRHYKDIFFTNGDDVQTFMSGLLTSRKNLVENAAKSLLGLDDLYEARKNIEAAVRRCNRALSQEGGSDLDQARVEWESLQDEQAQVTQEYEKVDKELDRIRERVQQSEKRLRDYNKYGDLDTINADLDEIERELKDDENDEEGVQKRLRESLESEELSWAMIPAALGGGMGVLQELHDRGVIPGTAIEVLRDRLDDGTCFCGTSLDEGSHPRQLVQTKIDEHKEIDPTLELLTAAYHSARFQKQNYGARAAAGHTFAGDQKAKLAELTEVGYRIKRRRQRQDDLKDKRRSIDAEEVKSLSSSIKNGERDIYQREVDQENRQLKLPELKLQVEEARNRFEKLQRDENLSIARRANAKVSEDLKEIVVEAIRSLEEDRMQEVAAKMSDHFLEIVGSDPDIDSAIFGSVTITEDFDIQVRTPSGKHLHFDAEINGASQRALTLSFIWALTEVAKVESPRIIDTPLGMVAGAVKSRLTESITTPTDDDGADYQVVLLLTRSEIRDIEETLDKRAGMSYTLTGSKDVKDLQFPWGHDHPHVRVCTCSHRQTCRVCARTYDARYGFEYRNYEATDENAERDR